MSILYRPDDGVAGDFIPYYWNGDYHLFYIKDFRDDAGYGPGKPWFHLVTRDFVNFEEWGEAVPHGAPDEQDISVGTGSVIEKDGTFHLYFTGINASFAGTGKPAQVVMRATSTDLRNWRKEPDFRFNPPTALGYELDDWRDPFIFWNDAAGEYWMLVTARTDSGPVRNRGCIGLATSSDLVSWEGKPPLWAPGEVWAHPCPDLFRQGDWWYMVYSVSREWIATHYRMARSLEGPWLSPPNSMLDGLAYCAGKTAGDETQRFAFAWLPTREGETDDGDWEWGGHLVVHEVMQQPDGALAMRIPATVAQSFANAAPFQPQPVLGSWEVKEGSASTSAIGRYALMTLGEMPDECLVETTVTFDAEMTNCGLLLRASDDLESYYVVRLEPANNRIVLDRWSPNYSETTFNDLIMLERRAVLTPDRPVKVQLLVDGTALVIYIDDQVALSGRMYDRRSGALGLFVTEGEARFEGIRMGTR